MKDFLIINPGKVLEYYHGQARFENLFIKIEFKKGNLSLSGVIGPRPNGDCIGSCGQVQDELKELKEFSENWNREKADLLYYYWERYHLNDLTAGTPIQEDAAREYTKTHKYDYTKVCEYLKFLNLYEVPVETAQPFCKLTLKGPMYKYGFAWLREEVPEHVIRWLFNLPETKIKLAWV